MRVIDGHWPDPADPERVAAALGRWRESVAPPGESGLADFLAAFPATDAGGRILGAIFGNSPFLTQTVLRDLGFFHSIVEARPDEVFNNQLTELVESCRGEENPQRLSACLRLAKRRVALVVALADIGGLWPLETVTGALTRFADTCLQVVVEHVLRKAHARGRLVLPDPANPTYRCGYILLGMGKLGAAELNYSSDIDLIAVYDDEIAPVADRAAMGSVFVGITREVVRLMEERTVDGYVFRTDLRLRPDPGVTPIAVSVSSAEGYYGSMALTWERSAMIKARVVAGDAAAGTSFLRSLQPFVWRRNLDFAAMEDIQAIKRRITAHQKHGAVTLNGHDIKVGRGGIREIEFFTQIQQLIYGGRAPEVRVRGTCAAIRRLVALGRVTEADARELIDDYHWLRRVEHRLQMIDDHQTHRLPESESGFVALAIFLNYEDASAFRSDLRKVLARVEGHYASLCEEPPPVKGPVNLVFAGADEDPETIATLVALGFERPSAVLDTVRSWLHGRYRATRSERARAMLTRLLPQIVDALSATSSPDTTLMRLDSFLAGLPAGIQFFSMVNANPDLLDLVAELLGASDRMGAVLSNRPALLEPLLEDAFLERLPTRDELDRELEQQIAANAAHYEEVLDVIRTCAAEHRFQAGAQMLRGRIDGVGVAPFLTDVAEAVIAALLPRTEAAFAERHGTFGREGLVVVAMGKLGGREMTLRSDLDLILVYDAPEGEAQSSGPKPLAPMVYYGRLTQRVVSALTAPTAAGTLYEVDTRLRPSGNAGPLATSLAAFRSYHAAERSGGAWTWEHMALTRARAVGGPPALRRAVEDEIRAVLCRPRDPRLVLRDVADMRARIERQHGTANPWEVKYARGGLVDIEFTAQCLQLSHAARSPGILSTNTAEALGRLAEAGLLSSADAATLTSTLHLCHRVQAFLRLVHEGPFDGRAQARGIRAGIARAVFGPEAGADRFDEAEPALRRALAAAHAVVRRLIEEPADALP